MAVGEPGHGGHIERAGTDTSDALKEEPRGAGAFLLTIDEFFGKSRGGNKGAEALHVGDGGIVGGFLSGAGVGNDLCGIEEELAATDAGAKGLQLATGYEVADGAVGHAEDGGGVSGSHEEPTRWRLRRGHRGGKNGGGGRHKQNGGNGRIIT